MFSGKKIFATKALETSEMIICCLVKLFPSLMVLVIKLTSRNKTEL